MEDNRTDERTEKFISELVKNSKNIAVIPSRPAGDDALSAAIGLYRILKKAEKKVSFIYTGDFPEGFSNFIDKTEITSSVSNRDLVVSVDYSGTPATKVHYSTQNDVLEFVLSPVSKDFALNRVSAKIRSFGFDLIIAVGAQTLDDFGQNYRDLEDEFRNAKIINLDNSSRNQRFGTIDVVDLSEDSVTVLILNRLPKWDLKLDSDSARAFLRGVSQPSNR